MPKRALLFTLLLLTGCNLTADPAAPLPPATLPVIIVTPTPAPASATPAAAAVAITATTTATSLPATTTATGTSAPTSAPTLTLSPTITPTASITPQATIPFRFDNWQRGNLPAALQGGVQQPLVVFTNSNDQTTIRNLATARPENLTEIIYLVNPQSPDRRIDLLEVTAATDSQIFPAAAGTALAYFQEAGAGTGLYILNMANGLSGRVAPVSSLVQRGIYSPPAWSPDGERLAVTLTTGYDLDIFAFDRGGAERTVLVGGGAYDFYPVWSPDGRNLAFVSDRATCPTWVPGEPQACDALTQPAPVGGTVHVFNLDSGTIRQVSDQFVTEPPRWLNNTLLVIAAGDRTDILQPRRTLWLANIPGGSVRQIAIPGEEDGLYLSDVWSPDGSRVLFQRVTGDAAPIVLMSAEGQILQEGSAALVFPRFGLAAAWSPTGRRIALGGVGGQCPYGLRVADSAFGLVATGTPPPSMCNPIYSPDGRYLAFSGISAAPDRRNPDGRMDVYLADENGFGLRNLSADLRGSMTLIGWLGGG